MKHYNYILLDWDGNLAQTLNVWLDALDIVLQKRGFTFTREQLMKATGGVSVFLATHTSLPETEGEGVLLEAIEIVKEHLPQVELYPDAFEVLHDLQKAGKHLALVTSSTRAIVLPVLQRFGLDILFEAIVCFDDVTQPKPHPEPLQKALKLMGGTEAEAIMIGDTSSDIKAAENAGVDSVLFYPLEHQQLYSLEALLAHKPTYVVSDFREVTKIATGEYVAAVKPNPPTKK
ncbi:MAG TPA: HAD family hydrolase [Verrucomicrobiae bacterium]|nr:HAD family hydrolase [Verrucomicrobiae bacterium]